MTRESYHDTELHSPDDVVWNWQILAEVGNTQAQLKLGLIYDHGDETVRDPAKALSWYRKAADHGHADAQCILGLKYYKGRHVGVDYIEAAHYFLLAADQGNADAQLFLAMMFESGQGVPQNIEAAFSLYKKSSLQGNALAQFSLGMLYEQGAQAAFGSTAIPADRARAVACYRIASASGNLAARGYYEALADQLSPEDRQTAESFNTMADITGAESINHFVSHSTILTPLLKKRAKAAYRANLA